MSLLPRSEGVDLLAGLEQAAVVLLLDLGSNVVEGYEGRGSVDVIFKLYGSLVSSQFPTTPRRRQVVEAPHIRFTTARSAGDGIAS